MSKAQVLASMDSRELTEWMAWEIEHGELGAARGDYHAALIASTIAEVHRNPKARRRPYGVKDFLVFRLVGTGETEEHSSSAAVGGTISTPAGLYAWAAFAKAQQDSRNRQ